MTRKQQGLLVAGSWILVVSALFVWLANTSNADLRNQLRSIQPPVLELLFLLVFGAGVARFRTLRRQLHLSWRDALWAGLLAALAFVMTSQVAPRTSRIFYDEQIYKSIGRSLSDESLAQTCNEGEVEYGKLRCTRWEYNKQPYGYPFLIGIGYRIAGVGPDLAHHLNNVVMIALVWVLYGLGRALFASPAAGFFAGLVAVWIPHQVLWSNTAAAEPAAAMFAVLSVLATWSYLRSPSALGAVWAVTSAVWALQFRQECLLLAPVLAVMVVGLRVRELQAVRLWGALLVGFVLSTPFVAHLFAIRGETWGASGPRMSLSYLADNLAVNGAFYLVNDRFPVAFTLLAIVGLLFCGRFLVRAVVLLHFLLFFGIYLVFYAGSYDYGADVRFSVMTYPPVALLAGAGAHWLAAGIRRRLASRRSVPRGRWIALVVVALGISWAGSSFLPLTRSTGEEAWAARYDVELAEEWSESLPVDSIVLTHNPSMFLVRGMNAGQIFVATTEIPYVDEVLRTRYRGGVYLHWSFWCNVADPAQVSLCEQALGAHDFELVDERLRRNYRYALYRLADRSPPLLDSAVSEPAVSEFSGDAAESQESSGVSE